MERIFLLLTGGGVVCAAIYVLLTGGVLRIAWAARTHLRTILVVEYCITLLRIVCLTGGGPKSGSCQAVSGSCCCCVQVLRAGAAVLH